MLRKIQNPQAISLGEMDPLGFFDHAARRACSTTKFVKFVCRNATARRSKFFSSDRMRKDIRLLSSAATGGITSLPGRSVFAALDQSSEMDGMVY